MEMCTRCEEPNLLIRKEWLLEFVARMAGIATAIPDEIIAAVKYPDEPCDMALARHAESWDEVLEVINGKKHWI